MELKRVEDGTANLAQTFRSIHRKSIKWVSKINDAIGSEHCPPPPSSLSTYYSSLNSEKDEGMIPKVLGVLQIDDNSDNSTQNNEHNIAEESEVNDKEDVGIKDNNESIAISPVELLTLLETIRDRVHAMKGSIIKFRERLVKKDPVTNLPRYGTKTTLRIQSILDKYDALIQVIDIAFGEGRKDTDQTSTPITPFLQNQQTPIVFLLRQNIMIEQDIIQNEKKEKEELHKRNDQLQQRLQQEEEQRILEEKQAAFLTQQREQEELARLAEEARITRLESEQRERDAETEADRAFVASVEQKRQPAGIKIQLGRLRESCGTEEEHTIAIDALQKLFSQIESHPDEVKFRRIRRDHPKFLDDIGRHVGGQEVLIAVGFKHEIIDEVKSFFLSEPNIESDMEGWSTWFDLIKKTVEIIEEEMLSVLGRKRVR